MYPIQSQPSETLKKPAKEVIADIKKDIDDFDFTADDRRILNMVDTCIKELKGEGITGKHFSKYSAQELSDIAGNLSILKFSLSELLVKSKRIFQLQKEMGKLKQSNAYEYCYENSKVNGKPATQKTIEYAVDRRMGKESFTTVLKEESYETVLHKFWNVKDMIKQLQVAIQVKLGENSQGKFMESSVDLPTEYDSPSFSQPMETNQNQS